MSSKPILAKGLIASETATGAWSHSLCSPLPACTLRVRV